MNSRHAAALALMGWYLITPSGHFAADSSGGLIPTGWFRLGTFDTETECDQALQAVQSKVAAAYAKQRRAGHKLTFQVGEGAECDDASRAPLLSRWPELKLNSN